MVEQAIGMVKKHFNEQYKGGKLIFLSHSGSRLHGTSTPSSDTDLKGIFIPSMDDIILQRPPRTIQLKTNQTGNKNSKEDIDIELFSIYFFFELLGKGDSNVIELMFSIGSKFELYRDKSVEVIEKNRSSFVINKTRAFVGFAMTQAQKYSMKGERLQELEDSLKFLESLAEGLSKKEVKETKLQKFSEELFSFSEDKKYVKIEEREEGVYFSVLGQMHRFSNTLGHTISLLSQKYHQYGGRAQKAKEAKGVDFKALAHAVRAIEEAIELLETGELKFPLKNAEHLKDIKTGKYSLEEISNEVEEKLVQLHKIEDSSTLPTHIDRKEVDKALRQLFTSVS